MVNEKETYAFWTEEILKECEGVLRAVDAEKTERYLDILLKAEKVFFIGVGRVLLSLEAIAKRYAHLGIHTVVVGQITEPAMTNRDVLIVGSGSGNTLVPKAIAEKAQALGAKVIQIGSDPDGAIAGIADLFLRLPAHSRKNRPDEVPTIQPMTSQFEQTLLLFGDITAGMVMHRQKIVLESLWQYHANLE